MDDFSISLLAVITISYGLMIYIDGWSNPLNIILFFMCLGGTLWGLKLRGSLGRGKTNEMFY